MKNKMKHAARVLVVSLIVFATILLASPAQAYPSFLPKPPPGHTYQQYCGWYILASKGVWCHWALVRIP